LEKDPNSPKAHYNLGVLYEQQGRREQAIAQYRLALELKPDFAEAHFNLALTYQESGEEALARMQLERLRTVDPGMARDLEAQLKA
jgi:tetratricopeptide (TPR) repeat protein